MGRRVRTIFTILSPLLFAAITFVWARSYFVTDEFRFGVNRWEESVVRSHAGRFSWHGPAEVRAPVNSSVPYWLPALLSLIVPAWPLIRRLGRKVEPEWRLQRRPPPEGHCRRCGYNLAGNVSGLCPECGEASAHG